MKVKSLTKASVLH